MKVIRKALGHLKSKEMYALIHLVKKDVRVEYVTVRKQSSKG